MNADRNAKVMPPLGFDGAVLVLTAGLSSEAVSNLRKMVKEIAQKHGDDDSTMLRRFTTRLNRAIRNKKNATWAREIQVRMGKATA